MMVVEIILNAYLKNPTEDETCYKAHHQWDNPTVLCCFVAQGPKESSVSCYILYPTQNFTIILCRSQNDTESWSACILLGSTSSCE